MYKAKRPLVLKTSSADKSNTTKMSGNKRVNMPGLDERTDKSTIMQRKTAIKNDCLSTQRKTYPTAPIQRYFAGRDLNVKAGALPNDARVSENLKVVVADRQAVLADDEKIRNANAVLRSGSKIMLEKGEKVDLDMETAPDENGMRTISFVDFYRVSPIYNPDVASVGTDTPRAQSGEANENPQARQQKHDDYVARLLQLNKDFTALVVLISSGIGTGVQASDPVTWHMALNEWLAADAMRTAVLKAQFASVAGEYHLAQNTEKREQGMVALLAAFQLFMAKEIDNPQQVVLPTDCGTVVQYIATGGVRKQNDRLDDNPDIGSNYYTNLPSNASGQGWDYHWAGVVMKDGPDNVTLESAGGSAIGNIGKSSWWFEMYGTKNVDQTFKKQIHRIHNARNRAFVEGMEEGEDKTTALEELNTQKGAVDNWTTIDSDQT